MQNRILVRPAIAADIPAITAIYRQHVLRGLASFEIDPPDAAEMLRRHAAVLELGLPYLAAEANGRIAGYAYATVYRARPAYRYTVENSVYVDEDCAGQVRAEEDGEYRQRRSDGEKGRCGERGPFHEAGGTQEARDSGQHPGARDGQEHLQADASQEGVPRQVE